VNESEFEAKSSDFVEVTINHVFPEHIKSAYSNHVVVQHTPDGEFYISFFELKHQLLLGTLEEVVAQSRQLSSLDAECVARLVVPNEKIPEIANALLENYGKYNERKSLIEDFKKKKG
jgi:hypothetical protein